MKHLLSLLLLIPFFYSCKSDNRQLELETSNHSLEDPKISISVPVAKGGNTLDRSINTAMREEVTSLLNFDDGMNASSIEEAMEGFKLGYLEIKNEFPEENTPWTAEIKGEKSFEGLDVLTIKMQSYLFTGGAHGYGETRLLNFDKTSGKELNNAELFKDMESFASFAEAKFREKEKIPADRPINSTGFMFEDNLFKLPENIGFSQKGLVLLYNPYEIASYADGIISLEIPYADCKDYLTVDPVR